LRDHDPDGRESCGSDPDLWPRCIELDDEVLDRDAGPGRPDPASLQELAEMSGQRAATVEDRIAPRTDETASDDQDDPEDDLSLEELDDPDDDEGNGEQP
jgi:hypothetical protein